MNPSGREVWRSTARRGGYSPPAFVIKPIGRGIPAPTRGTVPIPEAHAKLTHCRQPQNQIEREGAVNESPFIHTNNYRGRRDCGIALIERRRTGSKDVRTERNTEQNYHE